MAPPIRPEIVIGLDVGKSSHWACVATRDDEVLASKPVANRENARDSLFAEFPGALVVVDQVRNIGALALSRARAAGMPSAYLPGLAAHEAAKLFGNAKTNERDETYRCLPTIPGIGPKNGVRAGGFHRHRRFPEPRQAGVVLRVGAAQPPIRDFGVVGVGVPAGKQAAEEPPHILMQLPGAHGRPPGRVLREVPRPRHAARQGAEGRREKEAEGDLRGHEGRGPVRRVGSRSIEWVVAARRDLRKLARIPRPIEESGVDETIGTPLDKASLIQVMVEVPEELHIFLGPDEQIGGWALEL